MDSNIQHSGPGWLGGLSLRGATALAALGLVAGGVGGGFLISHAASSSSSTSTGSTSTGTSTGSGSSSTGSDTTAPSDPSARPFHPNENATHEAGESAAREAQENAGQVPTVP